jgi:hypothetical protein
MAGFPVRGTAKTCVTPLGRAVPRGARLGRAGAFSGDLELKIPRLRAESFFPSLLERRRRVDQSLFAVIMEANLHGTSTRKVDDLVKALGADAGSPSPRYPGSARTSMLRSRCSGTGDSARRPFPTCSWMPPAARPE